MITKITTTTTAAAAAVTTTAVGYYGYTTPLSCKR